MHLVDYRAGERQAGADAQWLRRRSHRGRLAQPQRAGHLCRPFGIDAFRRLPQGPSSAVHRDRRVGADARRDGRRTGRGRKDPVDRELCDVQSGPIVGASAHDHGAQRDQREDRRRARRRLGRPRRRNASSDRRHRDHARHPAHDRRRAVRLGADEEGDARALGDLGACVPALRTREVGGDHDGADAVRDRQGADVSRRPATSRSSRAASSSTTR